MEGWNLASHRSDDPGSLRDYVRMLGLPVFWSAFEDLDHSLRTGESAFAKRHAGGVFAYLAKNPEESRVFDAAIREANRRGATFWRRLITSCGERISGSWFARDRKYCGR